MKNMSRRIYSLSKQHSLTRSRARPSALPAFFAIATFFVFCREAKSMPDPRSDLPAAGEKGKRGSLSQKTKMTRTAVALGDD